jgi:hypothetical protein
VSSEFVLIGQLYWPLVAFAVSLAGMIVARRRAARLLDSVDDEIGTVDINLGVVTLPLKLKRSAFLYGFCASAALSSIAVLFVRDYASFFPSHLQIEVFYDRPGIETTLAGLNISSQDIRIAENWWTLRAEYYRSLDREAAASVSGVAPFFEHADPAVHSAGDALFIVKKTSGWQNYHVQQAEGEIVHKLDTPNRPPQELLTSFQKLETKYDYLRPTFTDIVIRRRIVIQPRFKQYLAPRRKVADVPFKVAVVGMTAIRVFPLPEFTNTLYLADLPGKGLVPIAYGVYETETGSATGAAE